ncbi:hypothetical protein SISSUDRAFT_1066419 [Sistotremastrum suecicum HHB10207 ss-3]|uniref:Uncharacterized protein n=1 Tax=Sistotremastrum suecicum HHB10207 ss-3 TaxID=1314776 RepID=A0A165YC24_9AGAM|nr:hypothetical protein SISSUDRAFT_1066419 [Sistotremastrum suecicum HHB10207 ss-3]
MPQSLPDSDTHSRHPNPTSLASEPACLIQLTESDDVFGTPQNPIPGVARQAPDPVFRIASALENPVTENWSSPAHEELPEYISHFAEAYREMSERMIDMILDAMRNALAARDDPYHQLSYYRKKWPKHTREEFPPDFQFFYFQDWADYVEQCTHRSQVISTPNDEAKGGVIIRKFVLQRDGTLISNRRMEEILQESRAILFGMRRIEAAYGRQMPRTWWDAHHSLREHYFNKMGAKFEELTFAEDCWKMEQIVASHYDDWLRWRDGEFEECGEEVNETIYCDPNLYFDLESE